MEKPVTLPHSMVQAERLFHVNYFLLYDLRRQIPEVMSVHITDNLTVAPGGYSRGCIIGYPSKWKLDALITHPAFLHVLECLQPLCVRTASFCAESFIPPAPQSIRLATPLEERQHMSVAERLRLILRDELHLAESHALLDASFIEIYDSNAVDLLRLYEAIIDEFELPAEDVHAKMFASMQEAEAWLAKRGIF